MYVPGVTVGVSFRGSPWLVPNDRAVLAETGPPFVSRFLGSAACSVVRHLPNGFDRFDRSDPYVSVRAVTVVVGASKQSYRCFLNKGE
jgi:hypothetical protein